MLPLRPPLLLHAVAQLRQFGVNGFILLIGRHEIIAVLVGRGISEQKVAIAVAHFAFGPQLLPSRRRGLRQLPGNGQMRIGFAHFCPPGTLSNMRVRGTPSML